MEMDVNDDNSNSSFDDEAYDDNNNDDDKTISCINQYRMPSKGNSISSKQFGGIDAHPTAIKD